MILKTYQLFSVILSLSVVLSSAAKIKKNINLVRNVISISYRWFSSLISGFSVIFRPHRWFISDFILISSRITCREIGKVVFFVKNAIKISYQYFSTLISGLSAILRLSVIWSPAAKIKKMYFFIRNVISISYQWFSGLISGL